MKATIEINHQSYTADLSAGIDISIPLRHGNQNPNCFHAPDPEFQPVRVGDFVGSKQEGGAVNFFNIQINPHGNGTHTECVGHISKEGHTIHAALGRFLFTARLVTVELETMENGDRVITREALAAVWEEGIAVEALIIRTLPNDPDKPTTRYTGTNPPYFSAPAMELIAERQIQHLLTDLPSVDRELDGGMLAAHHIFWNYPAEPRQSATITEMIHVENSIPDGLFLLNLQALNLVLDASPSRPVIFPLQKG